MPRHTASPLLPAWIAVGISSAPANDEPTGQFIREPVSAGLAVLRWPPPVLGIDLRV